MLITPISRLLQAWYTQPVYYCMKHVTVFTLAMRTSLATWLNTLCTKHWKINSLRKRFAGKLLALVSGYIYTCIQPNMHVCSVWSNAERKPHHLNLLTEYHKLLTRWQKLKHTHTHTHTQCWAIMCACLGGGGGATAMLTLESSFQGCLPHLY